MRFATISASLALAASVSGHATVWGIHRNGQDLGDGRNSYIRSPPNNNPVKDLSRAADVACNVNGGVAVPKFITAAAGDTLSFEWYHNNRQDDIIDSTHHGPIVTYVAPYTTGPATGPIWTKIQESGYDSATKSWAVDRLIANKGLIDVKLPASLKAGKYLVRHEIIALHEADNAYNDGSGRGTQFYPSCAQVEVTGSGTAVPNQNYDFAVGYTTADPGIVFNFYGSYTSYPIPGPKVWNGAGSGSGSSPAAPTTTKAAAPTSATTKAAVPTTTQVAAPAPTTTKAAVPTTTKAAKPTTTKKPAKPTATAGAGCGRVPRRRRRHAKRNLD